MNTNEKRLADLLGERIRILRAERSQESIAGAARDLGLGWTRSVVAAIETGRRELRAAELLLLPQILRRAGIPGEIGFSALLKGPDWIGLGPRTRIRPKAALATLAGQERTVGTRDLDVPMVRRDVPMVRRAKDLSTAVDLRHLWPRAKLERIAAAVRDAGGDAEQKAARRLGVTPEEVAVMAHRQWGRSLSAERDARAALRGSAGPQARGRITRELLKKIGSTWKVGAGRNRAGTRKGKR